MLSEILFPNLEITLDQQSEEELLFSARSTDTTHSCPECGTLSTRLLGSYTRTISDLPLATHRVRLRLRVRRFLCLYPCCPRVSFAESFPDLTSPYAHRSTRLADFLRQIAFTAGGHPSSRLSRPLATPTSRNSFLRLIRRSPLPSPASDPTAVGIDDWAWKKGQRYGALLV